MNPAGRVCTWLISSLLKLQWKNYATYLILDATESRIKVSLSDILPPVVKKSPLKASNNQNIQPKSAAYNILTSAKTLQFVKAQDKQYHELQKKAARFDEATTHSKRERRHEMY